MAGHKSQHYLPQFLMRRFGVNNKQINTFNIKSSSIIANATIKGQCARDYFYAKSPIVEKTLSDLEGSASAILRKIAETGKFPERNTKEFENLLRFLAVQHGRTPSAAKEIEELYNDAGKQMLKAGLETEGNKELLEALPRLRITLNHAPLHNVREFSRLAALWVDLHFGPIRAHPHQDFVLGDDPIIISNRFIIKENGNPLCGFASRGLIILLPIDPSATLCAYDGDVYRPLANSHISLKETIAYNAMQIACAEQNFYFKEQSRVQETLDMANGMVRFNRYQPPAQFTFREEETGRRGLMLHTERRAPRISPDIKSFLVKFSIRRRGILAKSDQVRNRFLADLVKSELMRSDDEAS